MRQIVESFYAAVQVLTGDGTIKKRLAEAYNANLAMFRDSDLPEQVREKFAELRLAMHGIKPLPKEDPVIASVRKMSAADARQHARQIVAIYRELVRELEAAEKIRLSEKTGATATPEIIRRDRLN